MIPRISMFSQEQVDRLSMIIVYVYESCMNDGMDNEDEALDELYKGFYHRIMISLSLEEFLCVVIYRMHFNNDVVETAFIAGLGHLQMHDTEYVHMFPTTEIQFAMLYSIDQMALIWHAVRCSDSI